MLAPEALRLPVVVLATLATIIASQSLISGVFSITYQASNLGYLPKTKVANTSSTMQGQVYLPVVNWTLAVCCIALVVVFRTSNSLAAAMGLSVSGTMIITTLLLGHVARRVWNWPRIAVWALMGLLFTIESVFFVANVFKLPHGGWLTLAVALVVFVVMTTRRQGVAQMRTATPDTSIAIDDLAALIESERGPDVARAHGIGVYLSSEPHRVPPSLLLQLRSTRALREQIYIVSALNDDVPEVPPARRVEATEHSAGIHEVALHYGFMQSTPVADDLALHLDVRPEITYYYLDRETVRATGKDGTPTWRQHLFTFMKRNSMDPASYLGLPADRVIELGTAIEI